MLILGQNKLEAVETFGEEQVAIWRRSFDTPPPEMTEEHPYYDAIVNDPIYNNGPPKERFPKTESLKLCIERSMPFWYDVIIPQLKVSYVLNFQIFKILERKSILRFSTQHWVFAFPNETPCIPKIL